MCVFYDAVFRFAAQMDLYTHSVYHTHPSKHKHTLSQPLSVDVDFHGFLPIFFSLCERKKERERAGRPEREMRDKRGPEWKYYTIQNKTKEIKPVKIYLTAWNVIFRENFEISGTREGARVLNIHLMAY